MKEECKYFLQGNCRFGKNCKYLHIRRTALIDPPSWVHSCCPDVDTVEIHPDEARLRFLESPNKFLEEWDDLFLHNYFSLCQKLDCLLLGSKVGSFTQRCVDIRSKRNLDRLVPVFNHNRLLNEIDFRNNEKRKPAYERQQFIEIEDHNGYPGAYGKEFLEHNDWKRGQEHASKDAKPPRDTRDRERKQVYENKHRYNRGYTAGYARNRDSRDYNQRAEYSKKPEFLRGHWTKSREDTSGPGPQGDGRNIRPGGYYPPGSDRSRTRKDYEDKQYRNRDSRYGGNTGPGHRKGRGDHKDTNYYKDMHEASSVDLTRDDVVIDEFLPNNEPEDFEF